MRYTVIYTDRVPDSVFIYKIEDKRLFGCDAIIRTNYDKEIDNNDKTLDFDRIEFRVEKNFFESKPVEGLEEKLALVEQRQRQRGWSCIRLDEEEFDYAINSYLCEYKQAVRNRLILARAKQIKPTQEHDAMKQSEGGEENGKFR